MAKYTLKIWQSLHKDKKTSLLQKDLKGMLKNKILTDQWLVYIALQHVLLQIPKQIHLAYSLFYLCILQHSDAK